ncbi:uncharacterized protein AB9W97_014758 [Spinachia spinachia]
MMFHLPLLTISAPCIKNVLVTPPQLRALRLQAPKSRASYVRQRHLISRRNWSPNDSAPVNVGAKNSIAARMLRENGSMHGWPCHIIHNTAKHGGQKFLEISGFDPEDLTVDVGYWFKGSTNRKGTWQMTNNQGLDPISKPQTKVPEDTTTFNVEEFSGSMSSIQCKVTGLGGFLKYLH